MGGRGARRCTAGAGCGRGSGAGVGGAMGRCVGGAMGAGRGRCYGVWEGLWGGAGVLLWGRGVGGAMGVWAGEGRGADHGRDREWAGPQCSRRAAERRLQSRVSGRVLGCLGWRVSLVPEGAVAALPPARRLRVRGPVRPEPGATPRAVLGETRVPALRHLLGRALVGG